jgi:hypothetical protein
MPADLTTVAHFAVSSTTPGELGARHRHRQASDLASRAFNGSAAPPRSRRRAGRRSAGVRAGRRSSPPPVARQRLGDGRNVEYIDHAAMGHPERAQPAGADVDEEVM